MLVEIKDLYVDIENRPILKGLNLCLQKGKIHAMMGPNGTGKSTLAKVLCGHPSCQIKKGEILFEGKNIVEMPPHERALMGIFIGFQQPVEIPGVKNLEFLRSMVNAKRKFLSQSVLSEKEFESILQEKRDLLEMKQEMLEKRNVNEGFSGGEKKRNEILQMALLDPKLAILDEMDSGLDIDALKVVAKALNQLKTKQNTYFLITHYPRMLEVVKPDFVHVLFDGKIVKTGDFSLAVELEKKGYDAILQS